MVLVTLIGEAQARSGNRFYYMGPQTECKECKLKTVCFNLEAGRQYEITGVRDAVHDCALNEDKVRVVEVEKKPILATIPKKSAMEGSVITFMQPECERLECEHWMYCHPIGIKDGDKLKVEYVMDTVGCPIDNDIVLSKLF